MGYRPHINTSSISNIVSDHGGQVFNAQAYGWLPDSTNRATQALALLQTVYNAGGGTIYFPQSSGTYRCDSQLVIPNDSASPQPSQPNIRFSGAGGGQNWYCYPRPIGWQTASVIDLRYVGTGAKLESLGKGAVAFNDLTIQDGGPSNSTPLFLDTNTTAQITNCTFIGSGHVGQDAIVLGGPDATVGGAITSCFQGYGTNILCNHFRRLNRGLFAQAYVNDVNFCFNSFQGNVGTIAVMSEGQVVDAPNNAANNFSFNLFEMDVYHYGIYLKSTNTTMCIGNSFWDLGGSHISDYFVFDAGCTENVFILGHHEGAQILTGNATAIANSIVIGLGIVNLSGGNTKFNGVPTLDPHVLGQIWSNSGVLTLSAG